MNTKQYAIAFEIASSLGIFAAPDTGSEPSSYPLPTASACKGVIESIYWIKGIHLRVVAVATCGMPSWTNFAFNSGSPLRKRDTIEQDSPCQIRATVLENPRFQILATVENSHDPALDQNYQRNNNAHRFQDQFLLRVKKGQSFHPPCMGWKEFALSYCGPQVTPIEQKFNTVLPAMLFRMFDDNGNPKVESIMNVRIANGVLRYTDDAVVIRDGILAFDDLVLQTQVAACWAKRRYKKRRVR
jgi:CRISPR-associated protein Cas5d